MSDRIPPLHPTSARPTSARPASARPTAAQARVIARMAPSIPWFEITLTLAVLLLMRPIEGGMGSGRTLS